MLTGCTKFSASEKVIQRALPDPPIFLAPALGPKINEGDDAKIVAARAAAAFREANSRLRKSRAWYLDVKESYGRK
jgi:hypothetical protein